MTSTWYVAACIVVPAVWGLLVGALYEFIGERRKKLSRAREARRYPVDYEI